MIVSKPNVYAVIQNLVYYIVDSPIPILYDLLVVHLLSFKAINVWEKYRMQVSSSSKEKSLRVLSEGRITWSSFVLV